MTYMFSPGNIRPTSMIMMSPLYSTTAQLRPISYRPPSGSKYMPSGLRGGCLILGNVLLLGGPKCTPEERSRPRPRGPPRPPAREGPAERPRRGERLGAAAGAAAGVWIRGTGVSEDTSVFTSRRGGGTGTNRVVFMLRLTNKALKASRRRGRISNSYPQT